MCAASLILLAGCGGDGGSPAGPGGGNGDGIADVAVHDWLEGSFYQSLSDETRFDGQAEAIAPDRLSGEPVTGIEGGKEVAVRITFDGNLRLASSIKSLHFSVGIGAIGSGSVFDVDVVTPTVEQTGTWDPVTFVSSKVLSDASDNTVLTGFTFQLIPQPSVGDEISSLLIRFTVPAKLASGAEIGAIADMKVTKVSYTATVAGDHTGAASPIQPGL